MPDAEAEAIAENAQIERFTHAVLHMWAKKGRGMPEIEMVHQCWHWPVLVPPTWAVEAATKGTAAAAWCPMITPSLLGEDIS